VSEAVAKEIVGMHTNSMGMTMDQIVDETREWPEEDVAELVDRIYRVKYGDTSPAIEAAWREEIHRRIAELESGRVQGIPLEETLAKARSIVDP
jgi:putative addiction module component (TIGR02574 family)